MDNFDKLFNDKLNEITENDFEFKESSWERFHNNWTEEEDNEPKAAVPLMWLKRNAIAASIIALLLMSNAFFAQQMVSTRSQMAKLTSSVEQLSNDIAICDANSKALQDQKEQENSSEISKKEAIDKTINHNDFNENFNHNKNIINPNQSSLLIPISPNNYNNGNTFPNINSQNSFSNGNVSPNINQQNNINIPNPINNGNSTINPLNNHSNNNIDNIDTNNKLNNSNDNSNRTDVSNNQLNNTEEGDIIKTSKETVKTLNKLNLSLNNSDSSNTKWWNTPEIPNYTEHKKASLGTKALLVIEKATPTNYQIGVGGQVSTIQTANGLNPIIAFNSGISGNALFFNRLRLQAGADYWSNFIQFDHLELTPDGKYDAIISELTTLTPYQPQDKLSKIEGQIHGFDVPLMAEILLRPDKKWNPYVGFGMVGRYYNSYKFEQYFYDAGNPNYRYEIKTPVEYVRRFDFSLWQSKAGFDFALTKHWLLNTEFIYQKSYQEQIFGLKNIQGFGVRIGAKYQF